jgi:hypothetical protein
MTRLVAFVRTDVSEESVPLVIKVQSIRELVTANVVPSSLILFTLLM